MPKPSEELQDFISKVNEIGANMFAVDDTLPLVRAYEGAQDLQGIAVLAVWGTMSCFNVDHWLPVTAVRAAMMKAFNNKVDMAELMISVGEPQQEET